MEYIELPSTQKWSSFDFVRPLSPAASDAYRLLQQNVIDSTRHLCEIVLKAPEDAHATLLEANRVSAVRRVTKDTLGVNTDAKSAAGNIVSRVAQTLDTAITVTPQLITTLGTRRSTGVAVIIGGILDIERESLHRALEDATGVNVLRREDPAHISIGRVMPPLEGATGVLFDNALAEIPRHQITANKLELGPVVSRVYIPTD